MTVLYFGFYDPLFTTNKVLINGLRQNGVLVLECYDHSPGLKKFLKLFFKHWKLRNEYDAMIIGFAGQLAVPFAKIITRKPVIFSGQVSLYDANVLDRQVVKARSLKSFYYWLLDWFAVRLADRVIMATQSNIDHFSKKLGVKKEKYRRIFNGAEDDIFRPLESVKTEKDFLVSFHGTFIPLHGVEFIARAAKILESEGIRFLIVGRGQEKKKVLDISQRLQLKNIEFIDFMPKNELVFKLAGSDACLGTFGGNARAQREIAHKIFECLAMRKPLITADTPAIRELFGEEELLLVKAANPESLAEGILKLKNDPVLRARLAHNGYHKFMKSVSCKILGGEFKKVIEELIRI